MDNMYKNFKKFLKKVKSSEIDINKKVNIQGYNWSLANGQFWDGDEHISKSDVELIYSFENALYQAFIFKGGAVVINREGLNKRMDRLLKNKSEVIRNKIWN